MKQPDYSKTHWVERVLIWAAILVCILTPFVLIICALILMGEWPAWLTTMQG